MVAQERRVEPVDELVFPEGPVDDELPALIDPQLRRRSDLVQEVRCLCEIGGRVLLPRRVDRDRVPPPVPRDSRHAALEPAPHLGLSQNENRHFTLCLQGCGRFHARKNGEPPFHRQTLPHRVRNRRRRSPHPFHPPLSDARDDGRHSLELTSLRVFEELLCGYHLHFFPRNQLLVRRPVVR